MCTETVEADEDYVDSHYTRPHWARATTEAPVRIRDVKEPVVALIDNRSRDQPHVHGLLQERCYQVREHSGGPTVWCDHDIK